MHATSNPGEAVNAQASLDPTVDAAALHLLEDVVRESAGSWLLPQADAHRKYATNRHKDRHKRPASLRNLMIIFIIFGGEGGIRTRVRLLT